MFDPLLIVAFWRAAGPSRWFRSDPHFDALVRLRLGAAHEEAALEDEPPTGPIAALARMILLDQVPRNVFRGTARAFATDRQALALARASLSAGFDRRTPRLMRPFFYLPLMHSEALADQELSEQLYSVHGDPEQLRYAVLHADIIRRFGRFPHRNAVLRRAMSAEEQQFLDAGGFRG